jgi:hypothetical protein
MNISSIIYATTGYIPEKSEYEQGKNLNLNSEIGSEINLDGGGNSNTASGPIMTGLARDGRAKSIFCSSNWRTILPILLLSIFLQFDLWSLPHGLGIHN